MTLFYLVVYNLRYYIIGCCDTIKKSLAYATGYLCKILREEEMKFRIDNKIPTTPLKYWTSFVKTFVRCKMDVSI